jgi:hypothetical protein
MIWQLIDFFKLVVLCLPGKKRLPRFIQWLQALITPLATLYEVTLYKMQHDTRVIYLEKMLNEYFEVPGYDPMNHEITKTIYIEDTQEPDTIYIFQPEEDEPLYLGTQYLTTGGMGSSYQFIVNIPVAYPFVEGQLRALINYYKLAGKRYLIQTY